VFKLIIFLYFAILPRVFAQEKYLAFIGGGGEPAGDSTIFDDSVREMQGFMSNSGWKPQVSFNGGHAITENLVNNLFSSSSGLTNTPFTSNSFESMIAGYEKKIISGDIKPGDQLMIQINSHGALALSEEGTHSIATSVGVANDLTHLTDVETVSLDRLQKLSELANTKGIQLAILDFSCHSGGTLELQNPNTCVISASGPRHYGFASFGGEFAKNMQKGKNLEDVFLETFKNHTEPSFPMISTHAGEALQSRLYELMTPYLYFNEGNNGYDKLDNFLRFQMGRDQCHQMQQDFLDLKNLLTNINSIFYQDPKMNQGFNELKNALAEYNDFMKTLNEQYLPVITNPKLSKETQNICFKSSTPDQMEIDTCSDIPTLDLLKINLDGEIARENKRLKNKKGISPEDEKLVRNRIEQLKAQKIRKEAILSTRPDYQRFVSLLNKYRNIHDETWRLATRVKTNFRLIYEKSYQALATGSVAPNPCRNFVL
jgi:hypothetical protein